MKRAELARLLRALLRLVEDDLAELRDAVAEIDHRSADQRALGEKRQKVADARYLAFDQRLSTLERDGTIGYSRKVPS